MVVAEAVGELSEDPAGERDVAQLDLDLGHAGEGPHDRQQRLRGQRRRLVGVGVDDLHDPADPSELQPEILQTPSACWVSFVGGPEARRKPLSLPWVEVMSPSRIEAWSPLIVTVPTRACCSPSLTWDDSWWLIGTHDLRATGARGRVGELGLGAGGRQGAEPPAVAVGQRGQRSPDCLLDLGGIRGATPSPAAAGHRQGDAAAQRCCQPNAPRDHDRGR